MTFNSLSVIGLGYVGLPTAAIFAGHGLNVVGVDTNGDVVDKINRGEVHFVEPGLEKIVRDAVAAGKLRAALEPRRPMPSLSPSPPLSPAITSRTLCT